MKNQSEENRFRTWLKSNYGIQDYEAYRNTQTEELAIQFAAQSVREYKEKLKEALIKANNGSKYDMVNQGLFKDLIESTH